MHFSYLLICLGFSITASALPPIEKNDQTPSTNNIAFSNTVFLTDELDSTKLSTVTDDMSNKNLYTTGSSDVQANQNDDSKLASSLNDPYSKSNIVQNSDWVFSNNGDGQTDLALADDKAQKTSFYPNKAQDSSPDLECPVYELENNEGSHSPPSAVKKTPGERVQRSYRHSIQKFRRDEPTCKNGKLACCKFPVVPYLDPGSRRVEIDNNDNDDDDGNDDYDEYEDVSSPEGDAEDCDWWYNWKCAVPQFYKVCCFTYHLITPPGQPSTRKPKIKNAKNCVPLGTDRWGNPYDPYNISPLPEKF